MTGRIEGVLQRPELTAYEGEHILLVGGAGFVGSHMADQLYALGAKVTVVDNLSNSTEENLSGCDVEFVEQSIEECDLEGLLRKQSIDRVIHLACGSLVQSLEDAAGDFHNNAVNFLTSLEAFRRFGSGQAFVYCSTGSVYGEPDSTDYPETTSLRPSTPYGTSKACAMYPMLGAAANGVRSSAS